MTTSGKFWIGYLFILIGEKTLKCKCKEKMQFIFADEFIEIYKCWHCGRILEIDVELINTLTWYVEE